MNATKWKRQKPSCPSTAGRSRRRSAATITVPDGVEARISTTGGILSLRSENARFSDGNRAAGCLACGTAVESSGYGSATDRVTVTISAGASSIVVR